MYEKVKVENSGVPEGACNFCLRPKSIVICSGCRHVVPNVRHRRQCAEHPREYFLMDIAMCRNCKGKNLLELGLDEIPDDMIEILSPPESPDRPTSSASGSGTLSPSPPRESLAMPSSSGAGSRFSPSVLASTGLSPIKENSNPAVESMDVVELPGMASPAPLQQRNSANLVPGRGRGFKRQRVSITQIMAAANAGNAQGAVAQAPVASPAASNTQAPPASTSIGGPCVCTRQVHFLVCSMCGYYTQGVRKFLLCPAHPNEKQGIKFCPECGVPAENLDETCF